MRQPAPTAVGDGGEFGRYPEAPGRALGLLHQAVQSLEEHVAALIESDLPLSVTTACATG